MKATAICRLLFLWCIIAAFAPIAASAEEIVPQVVDIVWKEFTTVQLTGVTDVLVLDEAISRADFANDKINFHGVARGETVAFVWLGPRRITIRLRIAAPPAKTYSQPKL